MKRRRRNTRRNRSTEIKALVAKAEREEGTVPRYCAYVTKTGRPCRQAAKRTSPYCALHDPKNAAAVDRGRRVGGSVMKAPKIEGSPPEVENLEGCVKQLLWIQRQIIEKRIPGPLASALKSITDSIAVVLKYIAERDKGLIPPDGFPVKLYDFQWVEPPPKLPGETGNVGVNSEDSRVISGEGEKIKGKTRGEEKSGSPLNLESQKRPESGESGPESEKVAKNGSGTTPEQLPDEEEEPEEKPKTIGFCETEAFWEQLAMEQHPGYEPD